MHHVRGAADAAQDDERPVHGADEENDPNDLARHQGDGHHDQGDAGSDLHDLDCQQVKY